MNVRQRFNLRAAIRQEAKEMKGKSCNCNVRRSSQGVRKMTRVSLGDGKWFETECTKFEEDTRWNGNNHISRATGSQWDHQVLYYTRSGNWVLNEWSQYQGVLETYEEISEDEAINWLINQEKFNELDALPRDVQERVRKVVVNGEV